MIAARETCRWMRRGRWRQADAFPHRCGVAVLRAAQISAPANPRRRAAPPLHCARKTAREISRWRGQLTPRLCAAVRPASALLPPWTCSKASRGLCSHRRAFRASVLVPRLAARSSHAALLRRFMAAGQGRAYCGGYAAPNNTPCGHFAPPGNGNGYGAVCIRSTLAPLLPQKLPAQRRAPRAAQRHANPRDAQRL